MWANNLKEKLNTKNFFCIFKTLKKEINEAPKETAEKVVWRKRKQIINPQRKNIMINI